ncbi:MAG: C4-dicarboxylate ABC transporter substrate-binding protein [Rhodobacterales bacterium]|nr:MAG: C4-dicarboxylate ABC transporter substrate-binding protein [Rhodobacterales bacterium]
MLHTKFMRASAVAITLAASALPASAETLKFAHWVPAGHTLTASAIEPLLAAVEGTGLEIEVYPGGELGAGPLEQYVRVVQGVADIVWGLEGYTSSQFPKTMVVELPGAVPEGREGYELLWNAHDAGLLDSEFPATRPLALWTTQPNIFIMRDAEVHTPDDLKGLKLRVAGAAAAATIEALGATPVQMPAGEMYNALQTGLIDGIVTDPSAIGDFKLDEVATSYTLNVPLGQISFYLVINAARYDGLTDEQKAAINTIAGRPLSQLATAGWEGKSDLEIGKVTAAGDNVVYTLSAEERAAFEALTLPVRDAIVAEGGNENVLEVMQAE